MAKAICWTATDAKARKRVVAIAAFLRADKCEIYTDVDGVYTTDPRIVPNARKLQEITYDEMLELASCGANVLHNRSVMDSRLISLLAG